MTLEEYVGVNNQDTFCQWVETKTRILGSIKGMTSIKFGMYQRKDIGKRPKNFINDETFTWLKSHSNDRNNAFLTVKEDILNTMYFAENGQFDKIDHVRLSQLFKWQIAFLYSNVRLIPEF